MINTAWEYEDKLTERISNLSCEYYTNSSLSNVMKYVDSDIKITILPFKVKKTSDVVKINFAYKGLPIGYGHITIKPGARKNLVFEGVTISSWFNPYSLTNMKKIITSNLTNIKKELKIK